MILKIKFYTSYISCESIVKNTLLAGKKIVLKVFTFLVWVRKNAICHIHFCIVWFIAVHEWTTEAEQIAWFLLVFAPLPPFQITVLSYKTKIVILERLSH